MAELSRSAEGRARIRAAWLEAVREHPLAYLRHRWAALDQLLRIGCANCESVMTAGVQLERRPGIVERIVPVGVALERAAWPMYRSALGRGILWVAALAACVIALGLRLHRGRDPLAAVTAGVALSGLAYTLAFAVIGVGSAMRYVHWAVMVGAIAVPLTISILRSPLPPRTPASRGAEGG
jgi:hypothetical protein